MPYQQSSITYTCILYRTYEVIRHALQQRKEIPGLLVIFEIIQAINTELAKGNDAC